MTPSDLQTEWARLLVDALARSGVTELVLSPGSRSTPFVLAFVEHGGFRIHELIDERVAAFFALGQARASGRPSVLLCTSGSAPTHYFPAIVEASVAHIPMIVLSADRPVAMLGCGESQTIDQVKLFGDHVRRFVDLGVPMASAGAMHALRRHAVQAVASSLGPSPGPVHLDARAQRPLEPSPAVTEEALAIAARAAQIRAKPPTRIDSPTRLVSATGIDDACARLSAASRVLIVCGPAEIAQASARASLTHLADVLDAPILAESTSQMRFGLGEGVIGSFDAIFRSVEARGALVPGLILQIGGAPIAKGLSLLDEHAEIDRIVLASHGHPDPTSRAQLMLIGEIEDALERLARGIARSVTRAEYRTRVQQADACAAAVVEQTLARFGDELAEGAVARAVVHASAEATLFVGNSLPVRELDTWCLPTRTGPRVLSQRGASGIDGNIVGAAGSASVLGATVALIGDVTFLHDIGGLAAVAQAVVPVVIVVINNSGGRIFEQLPIAGHGAAVPYFTTPHAASLAAASAIYGIAHARVTTLSALREALTQALASKAGTVIEAVVPASAAVAQHRALWAEVDRGLEGLFA